MSFIWIFTTPYFLRYKGIIEYAFLHVSLLKMILKLSLLLCFAILGSSLHLNYIETSKQLRLWKNISEKAFTNSVGNLKIDLFDIPDLSDLQNLTIECIEDMSVITLVMTGSDLIPSDFLQIIAMSKCLST